jgi:hypothetical protein
LGCPTIELSSLQHYSVLRKLNIIATKKIMQQTNGGKISVGTAMAVGYLSFVIPVLAFYIPTAAFFWGGHPEPETQEEMEHILWQVGGVLVLSFAAAIALRYFIKKIWLKWAFQRVHDPEALLEAAKRAKIMKKDEAMPQESAVSVQVELPKPQKQTIDASMVGEETLIKKSPERQFTYIALCVMLFVLSNNLFAYFELFAKVFAALMFFSLVKGVYNKGVFIVLNNEGIHIHNMGLMFRAARGYAFGGTAIADWGDITHIAVRDLNKLDMVSNKFRNASGVVNIYNAQTFNLSGCDYTPEEIGQLITIYRERAAGISSGIV